ncbi:Retrovirus-related Pol polyprotein from transposon RE2 [Linum perenne]
MMSSKSKIWEPFFLGLEVARNHEGIHLSQRKYTLEILEEAGFLSSKPVTTPMDSKVHLSSSGSETFEDGECYRRLVGKLIYLTNTRPYISFATQQVSQFAGAPTEAHYKAVTRILRYLKGAPTSGLFFPTKSSAYSDSDWAACPDSRGSVTGYAVYLGDSLTSWKSKKQTTISHSSCEAEYKALAHTACELQWLLYLLQELHVPHSMPATIFCDNQSAIHIAENPTFHEHTKHIELDCHLVREKVQANVIKLLHVTNSHQLVGGIGKKEFFLLPTLRLEPGSGCQNAAKG